jgi:hypothetical protein
MENKECFETSAYKIQTPENHLKERIRHSEQGKSLKSRRKIIFSVFFTFEYCPQNELTCRKIPQQTS